MSISVMTFHDAPFYDALICDGPLCDALVYSAPPMGTPLYYAYLYEVII